MLSKKKTVTMVCSQLCFKNASKKLKGKKKAKGITQENGNNDYLCVLWD